jgi:hypothetical protein
MKEKMDRTVVWFKKEKVTVVFPSGLDIGVRKWRRLPPLSKLKGPSGTPHPHRLVIGLEFFDINTSKMEEIDRLPDGEAEIRVRWNPKDVNHAGGDYHNLRLYYFHDKVWNAFGDKHHFKLFPDRGNNHFGWGVAHISNWADPPIAWDA